MCMIGMVVASSTAFNAAQSYSWLMPCHGHAGRLGHPPSGSGFPQKNTNIIACAGKVPMLLQDLWAQSLLWSLSCQLKLLCLQDPRHKGDALQHHATVHSRYTSLPACPLSGCWHVSIPGAHCVAVRCAFSAALPRWWRCAEALHSNLCVNRTCNTALAASMAEGRNCVSGRHILQCLCFRNCRVQGLWL